MISVNFKKKLYYKKKKQIFLKIFFFSSELGVLIKKWLKQIYCFYFVTWIVWMFSLFFYFHTSLLFHLYTYNQLKNSVNVLDNFNWLFKLNLFYLAVEFTVLFLSVICCLWLISLLLSNYVVSLFLYRYTWLVLFIFYIILLFINWNYFINESALYSFRNKTVTTQEILELLFEATRYRYNTYLWLLLFNINIIILFFLLIFGFVYLWIRLYFWHYKKFWKI